MMTLQNEHDADARVPVDPLVRRRWIRHDWLAERHDYDDGDCNITWGFAYVEATSFRFGVQWFRNDGLPIRRIEAGWLAVGWGKTHEWFCCDSA